MLLAHRKAHRLVWPVLALLMALVFASALLWHGQQPGAPVQLSPPAPGAKP